MPSTPMTSTESHNGVARQARTATERSAETWKQGAKTLTVPVELVSKLPTVDLTWPVKQYFQYVQKAVDLNRDLATAWAETVMSLSGVVREHAEKVSHIVQDQTESVADLAHEQAEQAEQAAREQAEKIEQAEKEQARRARQAEREQAKQNRERYQGLTKADLSDQLAERELPKTGTVEELIERLVSADSE
jgi:F0F1-type ATP synthase membrane subunit b/b'